MKKPYYNDNESGIVNKKYQKRKRYNDDPIEKAKPVEVFKEVTNTAQVQSD